MKEGEPGGWVESEHNLSQKDLCWVFEDAWISANAWVTENALIYGEIFS